MNKYRGKGCVGWVKVGVEKDESGERRAEEEMQQSVLLNSSLLTLPKGQRLPPSAWNNLPLNTHPLVRAHAPSQTVEKRKKKKKRFNDIPTRTHAISQNSSLQFLQKPRLASAWVRVCVSVCVYNSHFEDWKCLSACACLCVCKCLRVTWACVMSGVPYVPHKFVFTPKKSPSICILSSFN